MAIERAFDEVAQVVANLRQSPLTLRFAALALQAFHFRQRLVKRGKR